ncbi:MAG: hypothetical protein FWF53_03500 [Candidatus Azobacteroides sp.]|nr:hypothetical protein [Candidatus Azobacteroides sp.]
MIKIGLLGSGMIGNTHIEGFLSMKSKIARYTAVCDIDVFDLCLPGFMHKEYTVIERMSVQYINK